MGFKELVGSVLPKRPYAEQALDKVEEKILTPACQHAKKIIGCPIELPSGRRILHSDLSGKELEEFENRLDR